MFAMQIYDESLITFMLHECLLAGKLQEQQFRHYTSLHQQRSHSVLNWLNIECSMRLSHPNNRHSVSKSLHRTLCEEHIGYAQRANGL